LQLNAQRHSLNVPTYYQYFTEWSIENIWMPHPTLQDKRKLFGLPEGALRQHLGARGLPAGACSGGLSANVAGMGNLPSKCRISALQTCKDGLLPALGTGLFYFRLRGLRPAGCTCLGCRSRRLPGASPNSGGYGRTGRAIPGTGKAPFREPNRRFLRIAPEWNWWRAYCRGVRGSRNISCATFASGRLASIRRPACRAVRPRASWPAL
jgi:hypothetical protein